VPDQIDTLAHPQSTVFVAPEDQGQDHWITFQPVVRVFVDAGTFVDGLQVSFSATGSISMEGIPDMGTNNGSMSFEVYGTHWQVVVDIDISGTDVLGVVHGMGNISTYDLYNFVNNGANTFSVYGTYFESIVPYGDTGTNYGTNRFSAFGTYMAVVVDLAVGTDNTWGTNRFSVFGTYLNTVISADAGTDATFGTQAFSVHGTATFVVPYWGTMPLDTFGTNAFSVFGTYQSS
jgi:hypothetical protein